MKTMSAVDAKTHFGKFIDAAQREPVIVTKKNRPVGVLFSIDDIQDTIWGEEVRAAHAEGYLSASESEARISALLDAED
jgi:prevent-host-death family protein